MVQVGDVFILNRDTPFGLRGDRFVVVSNMGGSQLAISSVGSVIVLSDESPESFIHYGACAPIKSYLFTNYFNLLRDYHAGVFDVAFNPFLRLP